MKMSQRFLPIALLFGFGSVVLATVAALGACSPVDRSFGQADADAGADALVCEPGTSVPCYDGPQGTAGVGSCKEGAMTCAADGSGYGACDGQVVPAEDVCSTPDDEDCDGAPLLCPLTYLSSAAVPFPNNGDLVEQIAVDPDGNAILVMSFDGPLPFGDPAVVSTGAGTDIAVVKIDPYGKVLWARAYGGDGVQRAGGVAVDVSGYIFIAGSFDTTINMGTGATYMSAGSFDAFVAKLAPNGDPLTVVVAGDASSQSPQRVAVDSDGAVFVAGAFSGSLAFPGGPVLSVPMASPQRIFLAKFDASLSVLGAVQSAGQGPQELRDLTVGAQGNPILTGSFGSSLTYENLTVTSLGSDDIFVVKLGGKDLKPLWIKPFGGAMAEQGRSIDVDSIGQIALTGVFQGQLPIGADMLTAAAEESIFVAKLAPTGDPIWAKAPGGGAAGTDFPFIRFDSKDNIVMGGSFTTIMATSPLTFGGDPLESPQGVGFGAMEFFLAKLDPAGAHIASKKIGNDQIQLGSALAVLKGDVIMLVGGIIGQTDFGGGPIGADMIQSYAFATFSP